MTKASAIVVAVEAFTFSNLSLSLTTCRDIRCACRKPSGLIRLIGKLLLTATVDNRADRGQNRKFGCALESGPLSATSGERQSFIWARQSLFRRPNYMKREGNMTNVLLSCTAVLSQQRRYISQWCRIITRWPDAP
jgi:hypothetical protein